MAKFSRRLLPIFAGTATLTLTLTGCAGTEAPESDATATVVATTTQLGSVAEQITQCAGGETQTLMGIADDPHTFEASSAQIADMITADLVVANGLGLESSMQRSIDNAVTDGAKVFEIAPAVDPLPLGDDHDHADEHDHDDHDHDAEHEEHDHDHGSHDPHFWLDVARMADGAELLGARLAEVTKDDQYTTCGVKVADQLRDVDTKIAQQLSDLGEVRLVTDHAAYGYFADRYGVEISGVVIPGGSTDGEPSSQDLAQLTELLNAAGADALLTAKGNTNRMITALSEETGGIVPVIELYESGIGEPGSGAETYQDAMLYNAQALVDALN